MSTEAGTISENPLGMSDEDFLNMTAPGTPSDEGAAEVVEQVEQSQEQDPAGDETQAAPSGEETVAGSEGEDTVSQTEAGTAAQDTVAGAEGGDTIAGAAGADTTSGSTEADAPDYVGFYNQIMAPIKANGKPLKLNSPQEVIRLMQQGINYTQKMQELAPSRKILAMLKSHDLLDEDKLSFFIDLDKRDPEAIKKLLKDSGIDPLTIDTSAEPAYLPGNHRVSDAQMGFETAVEELKVQDNGLETLRNIYDTWDQPSKDLLFQYPETLRMIHDQREVGIYDRIAAEIDRRKTLGEIPANTPFLQAYRVVGGELTEANAFADLKAKQTDTAQTETATPPGQASIRQDPVPVATRVISPKPQVTNGDAASAASVTRTTPKTAATVKNPLAMSDDEFMKQFGH